MQQLFGFLGVTAALVVFTQPAWADVVQVTGVQVNPTENGIEVVVKTNSYCRGENLQIRCDANGTVSQVSQSSSDNTFIVDINNAQLQLPKGNTFSQDNPVTGITSVTVTPLNNTTIRIAVTGEAQVPDVEVIPTNGSVTLSVFSEAIATDADTPEAETQAEEIEINVVGRRSPTPQTETPATVDIKTEEELEREQPLTRTVGEALQTLPGITINRLGLLLTRALNSEQFRRLLLQHVSHEKSVAQSQVDVVCARL